MSLKSKYVTSVEVNNKPNKHVHVLGPANWLKIAWKYPGTNVFLNVVVLEKVVECPRFVVVSPRARAGWYFPKATEDR
jgi:hypothetical protein